MSRSTEFRWYNDVEPEPPGSPMITTQAATQSNQHLETFTRDNPTDNAFNIVTNIGDEIDDGNEETDETEINDRDGNDLRASNEIGVDYNSNGSSATVSYESENSRNRIRTSSYWYPMVTSMGQDGSHFPNTFFGLNDPSIEGVVVTTTAPGSCTSSNAEVNGNNKVPLKFEKSEREPARKSKRLRSPATDDDMDGEACPICLDSWSNTGEHRLVALKCGHLFGLKCVERWLRAQPLKERSCPTCKSKASIRDIRNIYARRLVATDTAEITALQNQIETLEIEKSRIALQLQNSKLAHRACIEEIESLKTALMQAQFAKDSSRKTWRFALEKNLEVCRSGGCRVLTYNCRTYDFYISQRSANNTLFPGYGIRKVNCIDYKLGQFLLLHPKPIRDIEYSQQADLLLSVSLDGCARMVNRGIPEMNIQAEGPLWSCTFDYLNSNEFYVGGVGGHILQYDIRSCSSYLKKITVPSYRDLSPVVSLCSTEHGLLSCHLNSCWLWTQDSMRHWRPHSLPIDGPFMSLSYDNDSKRALFSCRPSLDVNSRFSRTSRLMLCKFNTCLQTDDVVCEVEHSFNGSAKTSLMTRATWVKAPGASWVAAHSESDSALYLHGLEGTRTMTLPSSEPALDVCSTNVNGDTVLAALSESRLRIYKAVSTFL